MGVGIRRRGFGDSGALNASWRRLCHDFDSGLVTGRAREGDRSQSVNGGFAHGVRDPGALLQCVFMGPLF